MIKIIILFNFILMFFLANLHAIEKQDYGIYHQQVITAEKLIASEKYDKALKIYEQLFNNYDFIFLREYKIATQLALYLNGMKKAQSYLKQGILLGWKMKSIKRNDFLKSLRKGEEWKSIKKEYHILTKKHETTRNLDLRKQVKKMFLKDQWKAFGALFIFRSKAQDRYAEKRFAPQNEKQLEELSDILKVCGYPSERLIGNNFWMSTILSHHNSISQAYGKKDTLYLKLKPKLKIALKSGQISPFEFALIDEWYRSTIGDDQNPNYGILNPPYQSELSETNKLREAVYLRPIEIRNRLVDVQEKTGMK